MKIHNKLFLILFSFSLILITVLVLLIQWSIGRGMIEYVNSKESQELKAVIVLLEDEYKKTNDWSTMQGKDQEFGNLLFSALQDSGLMMPPPPPEFREPPPGFENKTNQLNIAHPEDIPSFAEHVSYALLDDKENVIAGFYLESAKYIKTAITIDDVGVGWLAFPRRNTITDGFELDYIEQQHNYLWIIALVMMILVALISLFLARHLAEPIKLIMLGMYKLTQGDYQQKIDLKRKDELGELSRDFNELAITLFENDSARKRWLANISHELRTPLAILRGELEAMIDDVRPLSKNNIDSANDEVKHLQNLVDDLQQLTSADIGGMHYRKKSINISSWLSLEAQKYTDYLQGAGICLELNVSDVPVPIFGDTTRLCQLFNNLINNSIKYSQASLLKISLEIDKQVDPTLVIITVEDNGVGVEEQHLSSLFEHLFRVENSRNRKTGGSGLGLSICTHIVAAHQGKISAQQSSLGGLAIVIELPLST